jgi:hypothetical protein
LHLIAVRFPGHGVRSLTDHIDEALRLAAERVADEIAQLLEGKRSVTVTLAA